jgi:transposase
MKQRRVFKVELYGRVRRAVLVEGRSQRAVAREFGIERKAIQKMLRRSVPPGYQRSKLGPWLSIIDAIMEEDKTRPGKQRHTAKRIFDRLKAEQGFSGGYTIVRNYVHAAELRYWAATTESCRAAFWPFMSAIFLPSAVELRTAFKLRDLELQMMGTEREDLRIVRGGSRRGIDRDSFARRTIAFPTKEKAYTTPSRQKV